jgi:hypothetical protein
VVSWRQSVNPKSVEGVLSVPLNFAGHVEQRGLFEWFRDWLLLAPLPVWTLLFVSLNLGQLTAWVEGVRDGGLLAYAVAVVAAHYFITSPQEGRWQYPVQLVLIAVGFYALVSLVVWTAIDVLSAGQAEPLIVIGPGYRLWASVMIAASGFIFGLLQYIRVSHTTWTAGAS